jgi:prevent-host-death family protein
VTAIASRELRNSTRSLLDRVEAGETITITVDGRPMAVLSPIGRRRRWISSDEFASTVLTHQADPGLEHDLEDLAGEMTDDVALS